MANDSNKLDHKIALVMTTLRNAYPDMTIQMAHVFILCCIYEGKSLTEISKLTNYPLPSISRKISDIGAKNRFGDEGLGLVETKIDPLELRKKQIYLTNKGRALRADLRSILST